MSPESHQNVTTLQEWVENDLIRPAENVATLEGAQITNLVEKAWAMVTQIAGDLSRPLDERSGGMMHEEEAIGELRRVGEVLRLLERELGRRGMSGVEEQTGTYATLVEGRLKELEPNERETSARVQSVLGNGHDGFVGRTRIAVKRLMGRGRRAG